MQTYSILALTLILFFLTTYCLQKDTAAKGGCKEACRTRTLLIPSPATLRARGGQQSERPFPLLLFSRRLQTAALRQQQRHPFHILVCYEPSYWSSSSDVTECDLLFVDERHHDFVKLLFFMWP